jgi:hypothetical protein
VVFNGSFGWLSLKPWLFFFFVCRIGVFCVMFSIVIIVISSVAVIVSVGFAGVAWVSSMSLVLVFVLVVLSVVKFVRDTWIRGRVDLRDFMVVVDLEIMLNAFFLLFLSLSNAALLGWTLFGRVVLPRPLGLWLLAVGLLFGFTGIVLGVWFGVRLLRLVRGRGG